MKHSHIGWMTVCLLLALLSAGESLGQKSDCSCQIMDGNAGEVLAGREVTVMDENRTSQNVLITDEEGRVIIPGKGGETLRISISGYFEMLIECPEQADEIVSVRLQPVVISLPTVVVFKDILVNAFERKRLVIQTPASVSLLKPNTLQIQDNTSILEAVNTVPGVNMESRGAGGSRRISIRGSTLRSPFGVRNVKAYWNDIPLSNPDGSTPLELIDPEHLGGMEIIRGPAGSIYGAGNGGVLLFNTPSFGEGWQASSHTMVGSDNLFRHTVGLSSGGDTVDFAGYYTNHRYSGYRSQEYVEKDQILLTGNVRVTERQTVQWLGTYYAGEWGLPGALTADEVEEDPRQALEYSETANAHVERQRTMFGMKHNYAWKGGLTNYTTLYLHSTSKTNPYGTSAFFNGHKREVGLSLGGRTVFNLQRSVGGRSLHLTWGLEGQTDRNELKEYDNLNGSIGAQRIDAATISRQGTAFVQGILELPMNLQLEAGLSLNALVFNHKDNFDSDSIDQSQVRQFDPILSPRVAISHQYRNILSYASVSRGFSPPTIWDVLESDGSFQGGLAPEVGTNYELGLKGFLLGNCLRFETVGYYFQLDEAIVPQVLASGETVFQNTGSVDKYGLEAAFYVDLNLDPQGLITAFKPWVTATYQDFTFGNYTKEGEDLSGNELTGTFQERISTGFLFESRGGIYMNMNSNYTGAIVLNDQNTDYSEAYLLVNGRLGWAKTFFKQLKLDAYGGINNITDAQYSSFLQWNGFGGRYFNPSPGRNWYAGIQITAFW